MNNLSIYFNGEAREKFYECNKHRYAIFDFVSIIRGESND